MTISITSKGTAIAQYLKTHLQNDFLSIAINSNESHKKLTNVKIWIKFSFLYKCKNSPWKSTISMKSNEQKQWVVNWLKLTLNIP